jgi:hypothetical protein
MKQLKFDFSDKMLSSPENNRDILEPFRVIS